MLKTMREELNSAKLDTALESMIVDAGDRAICRDIMLEACGDCEPTGDDPEMERIIATIPETEIDDVDTITESGATVKNEVGEDEKMSDEEILEHFIPDTEEE